MPTAFARSSGGKMLVIVDSVPGMSSAAPMPMTARSAMSWPGDVGERAPAPAAAAEDADADDQRAPAAVAVAERAGRQQQRGERQRVGVDDPLLLGLARPEVRRQVGQGVRQHGDGRHDHHDREAMTARTTVGLVDRDRRGGRVEDECWFHGVIPRGCRVRQWGLLLGRRAGRYAGRRDQAEDASSNIRRASSGSQGISLQREGRRRRRSLKRTAQGRWFRRGTSRNEPPGQPTTKVRTTFRMASNDTSSRTTAPRRERADARRNRERVLAAAQAVFAAQGPDASLEEIARHAEVGIGTLYRHFPTRQALLEAVFRDSVTALCDQADALIDGATPYEALSTWLRAQLAHATTYGSLAASAMLTSLGDDGGTSSCEAMRQSAALLLARAQAAGEVRSDVVADDVMRLIGALALAVDDSPDGAERADRLFALMMDGLRAGDPPLPFW